MIISLCLPPLWKIFVLVTICQQFTSGFRISPRLSSHSNIVVNHMNKNSQLYMNFMYTGYSSAGNIIKSEKIEKVKQNIIQLCQSNINFKRKNKSYKNAEDMALFNAIADIEKEFSSSVEYTNNALEQLSGTWELIYTNDDITRSSPFFWAFRKSLLNMPIPPDPLKIISKLNENKDMSYNPQTTLAETIFSITDSIPFQDVGKSKHFINGPANEFISQTEIKFVSPIGGFTTSSFMTTASNIKVMPKSEKGDVLYELQVQSTKVLKSSLTRYLPSPLKSIFDRIIFPSGLVLEQVKKGSSIVYMRNTFVDDELRICRNDADDKVFVYKRTNEEIFYENKV